jgi:hypothetical protein
MTYRAVVLVTLAVTGCWTSAHPADPPRWKTAQVADLLPDGAWIEVALDFDLPPPSGPPKPVEKDGSCQFTSGHVAFAGYAKDDVALVGRAGVQASETLACLAKVAKSERTTMYGRDVVVLHGDGDGRTIWLASSGLVLGGSDRVIERALGDTMPPATADRQLAPLIARARAGGQVWLAARVPRDTTWLRDAGDALGLPTLAQVSSVVASVSLKTPYRIDVSLDLDSASSAGALGDALELKRLALAHHVGPGLRAILDAVRVHVDGAHIAIMGVPPTVDWLQAFQDLLALIAELRAA